MKQGDHDAVSKARDSFPPDLDRLDPKWHRTTIMIRTPDMDLFSPIFSAHFFLLLNSLGWVWGRGTKQDSPRKHL
jgi:hypothetical protein